MKKVSIALIGAGQRGSIYAAYALSHPEELRVAAVAEPDKNKREAFARLHGIPENMCYPTWEELLSSPNAADAVLVCTQDNMHTEPAIRALEAGYHVLLEKPMSNNALECLAIDEHSQKYGRMVSVCHVLRFTPFFSTLKKILDEGQIGRLISIQHNENVGYWHQAHSYVRGNWRNSREASPMILAKSCHDLDILLWLADSECSSVASFGELTHFRLENAPADAPDRCLDGCPHREECPFYAPRIYINGNTGFPASVISSNTGVKALTAALKDGPYGRCVYRCDNDVVDHQIVAMEFKNSVTVSFTMCAFTNEVSRTIKLMGTKGEIRGAMEKNEIEITRFADGAKTKICLNPGTSGHGGGDEGIMRSFVKLMQTGTEDRLTSSGISIQSHLLAFAAEKSRLERRVIHMEEYTRELRNGGGHV